MFRKIKDFFLYDLRYGIENLIKWFPIIWKDRNWDYFFIFVILHRKLHLMEQNIRNNGCHVHNEKDADGIKFCVLLLDRLIKDEYFDNAMSPHYKKWGESTFKFTPLEDEPEMSELDITYPNVKTEQDRIQEKKDFKRYSNMEQTLKQQDIEMLFETMKKKIQTWWD